MTILIKGKKLKLVLATGNKGKVREIKQMCEDFEVIPYTELIDSFEIVEDGKDFASNALIKAKAVYEALGDEDVVVIADDSGISVDALGGKPGIYSARYAGEGASDKENLHKLVDALQEKGLQSSPAHYTAAIAIVTQNKQRIVHGWMHGEVIDEVRGDHGFGYDPIFIPTGYTNTLGELDDEVKKALSHRSQALQLVKVLLKTL